MELSLRLDQRAWLAISVPAKIIFRVDEPVVVPITITNTGKTMALRPEIRCKVEAVSSSLSALDTIYETGHPHHRFFQTMIVPNQPIKLAPQFMKDNKDVLLTPEMREGIEKSTTNVIVHGFINYTDIFGRKHWIRFCGQTARDNNGSMACVEYNGVYQEK